MSVGSTPFAFVDGALDRADHLRADSEALASLWPTAHVLVLDADGRAYADDNKLLLLASGAAIGGGPGVASLLGLRDGRAVFLSLIHI